MNRLSNTSSNSVFAVRFAHANAFGTSQTRKTSGCVKSSFFVHFASKIPTDFIPACRQTGGDALNILHIFLLSFFSCQNDINILLFFKGFSHNLT